MKKCSCAGLPQQEPESSSVQEAGAVELHPSGRLVVRKSPGQEGGVGFRVDQREAYVADGADVGCCAEVHKYTGVAKGNVERGPDIEPCKSYRKGCTEVRQGSSFMLSTMDKMWSQILSLLFSCVYFMSAFSVFFFFQAVCYHAQRVCLCFNLMQ